MKTLAGWIVGVFALGLVVGGVFGGASAVEKPAFRPDDLPMVDCGPGQVALFAPTALADGSRSVGVKCVANPAPAPAEPRARAASTAAPTVVASAATPNANANTRSATAPAVEEHTDKNERDWKDSAIVIGGAAGAGAGIGAIAKGGKGAALGAAIGGVAGTVYELARKRK